MTTLKPLRKWLLALLSMVMLLGVLFMISTRAYEAQGGYEFILTTPREAPRIRVEYLSYGRQHRLLTCGPKQASTLDIYLNRLVKWLGIQKHFTAVAYLQAGHNRSDQALVVYASFNSPSALPSMPDALSAYYVDEHQQRLPMQFAIGKSNRNGTRHLVAWQVSLPRAPDESCTVEIIEPNSGKQYATITAMKAATAPQIERGEQLD